MRVGDMLCTIRLIHTMGGARAMRAAPDWHWTTGPVR